MVMDKITKEKGMELVRMSLMVPATVDRRFRDYVAGENKRRAFKLTFEYEVTFEDTGKRMSLTGRELMAGIELGGFKLLRIQSCLHTNELLKFEHRMPELNQEYSVVSSF
jgi:hypothetical protein